MGGVGKAPRVWETALERRDSAPEDQSQALTGCDMDHSSLSVRLTRNSPYGQLPQNGAGFCLWQWLSWNRRLY